MAVGDTWDVWPGGLPTELVGDRPIMQPGWSQGMTPGQIIQTQFDMAAKGQRPVFPPGTGRPWWMPNQSSPLAGTSLQPMPSQAVVNPTAQLINPQQLALGPGGGGGALTPNAYPVQWMRDIAEQRALGAGGGQVPSIPGRTNIGPSTHTPYGSGTVSGQPGANPSSIPPASTPSTPTGSRTFAPGSTAFADPNSVNPLRGGPSGPISVPPTGPSQTFLNDPNAANGLGKNITGAAGTSTGPTPSSTAPTTLGSSIGDYDPTPGKITVGDYDPTPGSVATGTPYPATPTTTSPSMFQRAKGIGSQALGGAALGIGLSTGLNMAGNALRPEHPGAARIADAGGLIGIPGGAIGAPVAAGMGWTGLGAAGVGATAPVAGAAIAQGITGTDAGNNYVNTIRTASPESVLGEAQEGNWGQAALDAGVQIASPVWNTAARLFTGGTETDQDLVDVAGGIGQGAPQEEVTPQNKMDRVWDHLQTDPTTRQVLQNLYDARVAGGEDANAVAQELMGVTFEDYQMKMQQEQAMGDRAAQQAQAIQYMKPYAESIRAQGLAEQQLLQGLASNLPAAYQSYAQYAANSAPIRANTLADSYMAQASMAPTQMQQQNALAQQQSYQNQLNQQLMNIQIQQELDAMAASGQIPATNAQGGL